MTEKYGFVYLWFDRKHKRYYVGCHWGTIDDGYICSSRWMAKTQKRRPEDFKRRILKRNLSRTDMYLEEQRYFDMIKPEERKNRYYNLTLFSKKPWHAYPEHVKTIGQKISAAKTGKKTGCTPERAAKISAGKKAAFEKRQQELGYKVFPETVEKLRENSTGVRRSKEWKEKASIRIKKQWDDGIRTPWQHK